MLTCEALDGEGAGTLDFRKGLAPFPASPARGRWVKGETLGQLPGQSGMGEHWERSDLCEGKALAPPAGASFQNEILV